MAEVFKKKEFTFRGMTIEDIKKLSLKDFIKYIPSRERRSLKRGLTEEQKKLVETIKNNKKSFIKTHQRDMIIIPEMVGKKMGIYNGKEFITVDIVSEMLGHRLGEFTYNRKKVDHKGPGIGATKGSKFSSLK
jgi:small subunit ribosomal protein S19